MKKHMDSILFLNQLIQACSNCGKIRDEDGAWLEVDEDLYSNPEIMISHGICPVCMEILYPEFMTVDV